MPPHDHHPPHHHFWFPEPSRERLIATTGPEFGSMAHRVLSEHGAPPEHRILLEVLLCTVERLAKLERAFDPLGEEPPSSSAA